MEKEVNNKRIRLADGNNAKYRDILEYRDPFVTAWTLPVVLAWVALLAGVALNYDIHVEHEVETPAQITKAGNRYYIEPKSLNLNGISGNVTVTLIGSLQDDVAYEGTVSPDKTNIVVSKLNMSITNDDGITRRVRIRARIKSSLGRQLYHDVIRNLPLRF